ncbi:helix-turn-helix domain-containing protein [Shewanella amazonensis]|uniref:HTH cro/C1-type domain-containing protein n=1 Tax=Shewanella amazonensis (strain ATCC BAA-1098 / SB2B) TaxID=326297 RepID=A1S963_SHEAM|nr:helix-turn-helix transcriptional regulator [Shewanella amazonensis]ABM00920.1 hypothetical protein Sama_2717 [Shewanella amazonensis SB2B]
MTDKNTQAQIISSKIKSLRAKLDWNQSRLATEAGISGAALSKIEQGDKRVPTIVVLRKLATALKVDVHELTGEDAPNRSAQAERTMEFYRKFGVLEELSEDDQKRLIDMANRLKEITNK